MMISLATLASSTCQAAEKDAVSFPDVKNWNLTVLPDVYTPGNLWDLINGAAESYLSYDFVDLHLGDYEHASGTVIHAEVYRHSTPVNAYGIYTAERSPEYKFVEIGAQGYLEEGVLNFLAGQFYSGAPLLQAFQTPANQRTDISTDPDIYNQTTPSDIGMLMEDIYQCTQRGEGNLLAVFPDEFTQQECQAMINYLTRNDIGLLIEAGVPDGTPVAHKHGWVTYFGVMNTLGDAGIVYTPGGNYVLSVFIHHPDQLIWDPASELVAVLSEAIYNYFNQVSG